MHVLHVIPSVAPRHGGPSAALAGLALAQHGRGMSVTVVTDDASEDSHRVEDLRKAGLRICNLKHDKAPEWWRPRIMNRLVKFVEEADVVHIHGVWERVIHEAAVAAHKSRVPYVVRSCGMLDEWSLRRKWVKKKLYLMVRFATVLRRAAALHCTSEMEAASIRRAGIQCQQVIVEPNGLAVDQFAVLPPAGSFRDAAGIGDRPLVAFLGRVHPGKGLEYLLPALSSMETRNVVVAVVGPAESAFAREIMRRAAALAPRCEVVFLGLLPGVDRIPPLVDADVFALPSEHENFGVAVVEALAAGCPVVVSHHVGLATEIEKQCVGTATSLMPADIARALDDWIARGKCDPSGRERRRAYALTTYDWNNIAARWQGHYQRLTA